MPNDTSSAEMNTTNVDVVIVGAGLSGLAAAHELYKRDQSVKVAIVEASSRVGGRNFVDDEGTDLGSAYIGPTQDRIARLVDELGLGLCKVNTVGKTTLRVHGRSSLYEGDLPSLSLLALLDLNAIMVYLDNLASSVHSDAPHRTPHAQQLDTKTMEELIRQRCWTADAAGVMRSIVRALCCVEPTEISVLALAWYVASSGNIKRVTETKDGAQDSKVVGGTGRISLELAKKLPSDWLFFNAPVSKIDYSAQDLVMVTTSHSNSNGSALKFVAKAIVLAIPPIQQLRIDYSPPISPNRRQALQHWPMGHVIKTFMYYEKAFWRDQGLNGQTFADEGISVCTMDDTKPDGTRPCIMGFVLSDQAAQWSDKTPQERQEALGSYYAKLFGCPQAANPIRYKEKIWADEVYVGGCYVGLPVPGALTKWPNEVQKSSLAPHVLVAGTETAKCFVGYMDGAVESGERAARNALVHLGKLSGAENYECVSRPQPSKQMPFVDMKLSSVEKYFLPSVPQALAIAGGAIVAVGAFAFLKKDTK